MFDTGLVLASLHLVALAMGLGGLWSRARALHDSLRRSSEPRALRRAYTGDAWWTAAILIWLITGIWQLRDGAEHVPSLFDAGAGFLVKMGLFAVVVALEVWPMIKLARWRFSSTAPSMGELRRVETISYVQCLIVVGIVVAAASMARGTGAPSSPATVSHESKPVEHVSTGEVAHVAPSGTTTITNSDLALLASEIAMPLRGIDADSLKSNFDARRAGGLRRHEALDIMAPRFTPIVSAAKGRVLKLFTSVAGGLMIYAADSSERFILMYAHLDHYASGLRDGLPLDRGQLIGYVGSTGNASATAPHLHFGILRSADVRRWSKGTATDPLPILRVAGHRAAP